MYTLNQESVIDATAVAIENGGYLMIESFSIRNFRCFKDLNSTLKRFNIVIAPEKRRGSLSPWRFKPRDMISACVTGGVSAIRS